MVHKSLFLQRKQSCTLITLQWQSCRCTNCDTCSSLSRKTEPLTHTSTQARAHTHLQYASSCLPSSLAILPQILASTSSPCSKACLAVLPWQICRGWRDGCISATALTRSHARARAPRRAWLCCRGRSAKGGEMGALLRQY